MNGASPADLDKVFGIQGELSFSRGAGGLVLIEVSNSQAVATIAMQGAHLLRWRPADQQAVIWLSSDARFTAGKSIRGGIPVCWPWFGPHATDSELPAHGFARTVEWALIEAESLQNGSTRLVFLLQQDNSTREMWPFDAQLVLQMTIGRELQMELLTRNTGHETFILGQALHTYFEVSDVRDVAIHGLENCTYIDKLDHDRKQLQSTPLLFDSETDRIYLDSTADCVIADPGLKRVIRIQKTGSRSTVVWNPWIEKSERMGDMGENGYLQMVCVESANAADDVVTLEPNCEHRLSVIYQLESF